MRSRLLSISGCLTALAVIPSCGSSVSDPSVVVNEKFRVDPKVENEFVSAHLYDVTPGEAINQILADSMVFSPEGIRHLVAEMGPTQVVYGTDIPLVWPDTIDAILQAEIPDAQKIEKELKTEPWGDRVFTVKDPDGYNITFAKTVEQVPAEEAMERIRQQSAS